MRYCHIYAQVAGEMVWAILVWDANQELPNIRFAKEQNAQTKMLAAHAPQAVASLISLGYTQITIEGAAA